ncbi:MAG: hypothetical protein ACK6EB_37045, partial [Planctomyces sp.]
PTRKSRHFRQFSSARVFRTWAKPHKTEQKNSKNKAGSVNTLQILKKLLCLHNFTDLVVEFPLFACQE